MVGWGQADFITCDYWPGGNVNIHKNRPYRSKPDACVGNNLGGQGQAGQGQVGEGQGGGGQVGGGQGQGSNAGVDSSESRIVIVTAIAVITTALNLDHRA